MGDTLYIVMPAYNEGENIEETVKNWYPVLALGSEDSRLVIADSGSSDNTHEVLENLQKEYDKLVILSDTGKQHGPKVIALYKYASERADYVFQTDSDGQTDPAEFKAFWDLRGSYDAVIGNRVVRGDGKSRKMVENTVCLLLRIIFGVKVEDANAPFRLIRCSMLSKYLDRFDPDYNLPNIMLVVFFSHYKEKITFREISFKARQKGTNSIDIKKIVKIGIKAVGDFRRFKKTL
ncbi:MAG: glycosyltransferase family 2 protein [Lachnospiraceae bacterium]|nr:glycosyltransferase family 2 protein [Lachnospiraceae bacterium]